MRITYFSVIIINIIIVLHNVNQQLETVVLPTSIKLQIRFFCRPLRWCFFPISKPRCRRIASSYQNPIPFLSLWKQEFWFCYRLFDSYLSSSLHIFLQLNFPSCRIWSYSQIYVRKISWFLWQLAVPDYRYTYTLLGMGFKGLNASDPHQVEDIWRDDDDV